MSARLPLVYWRSVAPDDSDLLQRFESPAFAQEAGPRLNQIVGPQLDALRAAPERPELTAYLSPDGGAVERLDPGADDAWPGSALRSNPGRAHELLASDPGSARELWAGEIRAADQLSIREDEFVIPRLKARNLAQSPVLLPAGTAFLGGAQNRMLLEPTVLEPGAERSLPVYCVEAGRWEDDPEHEHFRSVGRVPQLFLGRMQEARARLAEGGTLTMKDREELQLQVWETVLGGLTLAGQMNATMDLMNFSRRVSREQTPPLLQGNRAANGAAGGPWGCFHAHRESGLSGCMLFANPSYGPDALFALKSDLHWRGELLAGGKFAREYFRIFNEERRLAIRCLPDGQPLRDLRGKPILFEYSNPEDLQNSFRPPLEQPPPAEPLSLASPADSGEPPTWTELREHLGECRFQLQAANAVASQRRGLQRGALHMLHFAHPRRSILGTGLLAGGRPVYLEATAFRD